MTLIVPVPQQINGHPVLGAIAAAARPGELPFQFIVICQQHRAQPDGGPYVTWRVGTRDGREWAAENGHYDLSWPEAVASFVSRASLPAIVGPARPAGRRAPGPPGTGGPGGGQMREYFQSSRSAGTSPRRGRLLPACRFACSTSNSGSDGSA